MVLAHKNRNIDQWNKIESPEINPCTNGYLTLTKEARIYNGAKTTFSINGTGKTGHLHLNNAIRTLPNAIQFSHSVVSVLCDPIDCSMPCFPVLTPYTKTNSNGLKT